MFIELNHQTVLLINQISHIDISVSINKPKNNSINYTFKLNFLTPTVIYYCAKTLSISIDPNLQLKDYRNIINSKIDEIKHLLYQTLYNYYKNQNKPMSFWNRFKKNDHSKYILTLDMDSIIISPVSSIFNTPKSSNKSHTSYLPEFNDE